jgi:hypothetical protein
MGMTVVRYQPKPDQADENQRLVEAVFAELAVAQPAGLRYATMRVADGSFVHIASIEGEGNPLSSIAAFAEFVGGVNDRCEPGNGPNPQPAVVIGSYGFPVD